MHLVELVARRARPGGGLLLALTQRCPLSCAHCSTASSLDSPQHPDTPFRRLVASFRPDDRPDVIFMSGGEPLLRPELVRTLALTARAAGSRSALLSGMFFARGGGVVPPAVRRAVSTLDHFSASLDTYHEREVARDDVFTALTTIADLVPDVSLHVVGHSDDDPYLVDLLADVRRRFGDRVPVLAGVVRPETFAPDPCEFAAWPLVDYDGSVFACCQQTLVRTHRPPHLLLGHAAVDPWPVLRRRLVTHPVLRSVRALGAAETARRAGAVVADSVCATCVGLRRAVPVSDAVVDWVASLFAGATPTVMARRWGAGRHAHLVERGWDG